eukprot:943860-Pyramimonas_sp.AAC.2
MERSRQEAELLDQKDLYDLHQLEIQEAEARDEQRRKQEEVRDRERERERALDPTNLTDGGRRRTGDETGSMPILVSPNCHCER